MPKKGTHLTVAQRRKLGKAIKAGIAAKRAAAVALAGPHPDTPDTAHAQEIDLHATYALGHVTAFLQRHACDAEVSFRTLAERVGAMLQSRARG